MYLESLHLSSIVLVLNSQEVKDIFSSKGLVRALLIRMDLPLRAISKSYNLEFTRSGLFVVCVCKTEKLSDCEQGGRKKGIHFDLRTRWEDLGQDCFEI